QAGEDGLDVLAGAQRVGAEVGALAGVVADVEAANGDLVAAARGRVGDLVVREDPVPAEVADGEVLLRGTAAAQVDLFFTKHRGSPRPSYQSAPVGRPRRSGVLSNCRYCRTVELSNVRHACHNRQIGSPSKRFA